MNADANGLPHERWARQKTAEGLSDGAHMARRKFNREFKISAVKMVNEQGCSVAETAKNLGVDANSVRGWVARLSAEPGMAPAGEGALMAEVRQLRKENARLQMEREILKKAAQWLCRIPRFSRLRSVEPVVVLLV